jgi:hypothetical protein
MTDIPQRAILNKLLTTVVEPPFVGSLRGKLLTTEVEPPFVGSLRGKLLTFDF